MHLLIARRVLDMCELVMANQEMQHEMFVQGAYSNTSLISLYYHIMVLVLLLVVMVIVVVVLISMRQGCE